jgi:hypothetical protein
VPVQLLSDRGDTVRHSSSVTRVFSGLETTNDHRSVSRKFVECDRAVFVTQSLTAPRVAGDVALRGVQFLTTIVRVIRSGGSLAYGGPSTVFESFWSTSGLETDGNTRFPASRLEPFIDAGIHALDATLTREQQVLEDLLMDAASAEYTR